MKLRYNLWWMRDDHPPVTRRFKPEEWYLPGRDGNDLWTPTYKDGRKP